jgi:hypothetical protein
VFFYSLTGKVGKDRLGMPSIPAAAMAGIPERDLDPDELEQEEEAFGESTSGENGEEQLSG